MAANILICDYCMHGRRLAMERPAVARTGDNHD